MRRIFLAGLVFFGLTSVLMANETEIPVKIKAQKFKSFENSNLIEASGSVEVVFQNITILSDKLQMDSATKVVTAEGNVRLLSKEYSATSQKLTYDANRELPVFHAFKAKVRPAKLRGPLFIEAQDLKDEHSRMRGEMGHATTCDFLPPHYYLAADKIEYYPDDHFVGWNTVAFIGEFPMLWLPYLYYDLHGKQKKNWSFGHNNVEGDFFKTAWNYPAGSFLIDYLQNKGFGYGTEAGYNLAAFGLGTVYLYHLNEKDTGTSDWSTRLQHEIKINPATLLKLNHSYINTYLVPNGRLDQTAFGLNLNYADRGRWEWKLDTLDDRISQYQKYALQFNQSNGKQSANYYYNYDFAKNSPSWTRKSQRLFFSQPLFSDSVQFSSTTSYLHNLAYAGDSGEERIEPQLELTGSRPNYSWRYTQNWFVDLRQDLSPGVPRYESLEKLPEFEISPRIFEWKGFSLQSTFGYGAYREVKRVPLLNKNREFSAQRYRATANLNKNVPLGFGTNLLLGAGIDQFQYSPGDQLYAFRESANLQTDLFNFYRNEVLFQKGNSDGNSPFFFDKLNTNYHSLKEKMTFYFQDKFRWSLEGGRNWQAGQWLDVTSNLTFNPDKRVGLLLDGGWDIQNTRYKDLVASLRLTPVAFFALQLSAAQDLNGSGLKTGSALYEFNFLDGQPNQTNIRVSQAFDSSTKEFKVRDIMLAKQLHCWEMKAAYSDYRKEISISFSLKALPDQPFGFSSGRGFYFEGFEQLQNEFKNLLLDGGKK